MNHARISGALCVLAAVILSGSQVASAATPAVRTAAPAVTEYYNGGVYTLTPHNWHGAKDCAVIRRTLAHCFDSATQLNAFTARTEPATNTVHPLGFNCSGWTKIWNGRNWTNRGLAFSDWGYPMNLDSYVTPPFEVISWFSDGQRGYSSNNCWARIFKGRNGTGSFLYLPADGESVDLGTPYPTYSIELYRP